MTGGAWLRVGLGGVRGWICAAALALLLAGLSAGAAPAQGQGRAEPVTGPGVVTIGNIRPGAYVEVRSGPAAVFPAIAALPFGTRVRQGLCVGGGSARWCLVETMDGRVSGFVGGRYLVEAVAPPALPPAGEGGTAGPDFWAVQGLPRGDRLNVRREPSQRSPALATLGEGEIVRNLGCRREGQARWCRIRSTTGMDVTGWVNARFLREASGPPMGGGWAGGGGPDAWVVAGLAPGDLLNLRAEPSARSQVLARLMPGDRLQNLGCQNVSQTRWCRVRTLTGVDLVGWVNGRYLREP